MKKREKYDALLEAAKRHREQATEHRLIALALEDEARNLKRRAIAGRFWRVDE